MIHTHLLEINFTAYVPTTIIGLVGLIFAYLYFYFKNKDDNNLKQIESVNIEQRNRAIEAQLSELGVSIDTSTLTADQKYNLLVKALSAKTRKYLIIAFTTIILAFGLLFLLTNKSNDENPLINPSIGKSDSLPVVIPEKSSIGTDDKPIKEVDDKPFKEFTLTADQQFVINDLKITLTLPDQIIDPQSNSVKIRIWRNIEHPLSDTAVLDPISTHPGVVSQLLKVNAITPVSITDVGQYKLYVSSAVLSGQKVQSIEVKMYKN